MKKLLLVLLPCLAFTYYDFMPLDWEHEDFELTEQTCLDTFSLTQKQCKQMMIVVGKLDALYGTPDKAKICSDGSSILSSFRHIPVQSEKNPKLYSMVYYDISFRVKALHDLYKQTCDSKKLYGKK